MELALDRAAAEKEHSLAMSPRTSDATADDDGVTPARAEAASTLTEMATGSSQPRTGRKLWRKVASLNHIVATLRTKKARRVPSIREAVDAIIARHVGGCPPPPCIQQSSSGTTEQSIERSVASVVATGTRSTSSVRRSLLGLPEAATLALATGTFKRAVAQQQQQQQQQQQGGAAVAQQPMGEGGAPAAQAGSAGGGVPKLPMRFNTPLDVAWHDASPSRDRPMVHPNDGSAAVERLADEVIHSLEATLGHSAVAPQSARDAAKQALREHVGIGDEELQAVAGDETMTPWQRTASRIFRFWDDPESSKAALVASCVVLALILISTVTFILSSVSYYEGNTALLVIEWICVIVFSVEYLSKLVTASKKWAFFCAPLNLIDMVAILPFWLEQIMGGALGGTAFLRVVRLVRVFRVLKLGGKFEKLQVVTAAVVESSDMLGMLAFLLLLTMIIFSSLIYYAEYRLAPNPDPEFHSIPASFWWCIVTLMTVGYGDAVPRNYVGQIIASMTMIASIIIMALPISVIGANFTQQWVVFKERQKLASRLKTGGSSFSRLLRLLSVHNLVMEELIALGHKSAGEVVADHEDIKAASNSALKVVHAAEAKGEDPILAVARNLQVPGDGGEAGGGADDARAASGGSAAASNSDGAVEAVEAAVTSRDFVHRLERKLDDVREDTPRVDELLALTELMRTEDFAMLLDNSLAKYKRLKSLAEEGLAINKDCDKLMGFVRRLKQLHLPNSLPSRSRQNTMAGVAGMVMTGMALGGAPPEPSTPPTQVTFGGDFELATPLPSGLAESATPQQGVAAVAVGPSKGADAGGPRALSPDSADSSDAMEDSSDSDA